MATTIRKAPERPVLCSTDVEMLTGLKERAARHMLARIKRMLSKPLHSFVTVDEFVEYTRIPKEIVKEVINFNK